jgi:hypothetical protein
MTAFKKFDPRAFLERQWLAPDSTETLAALATLAGPSPENEIRGTEPKILFQPDTRAVRPKSIEIQRDGDGVEHRLDQLGKNQSVTPTPAKAAKLAKVQATVSAAPYQAVFEALERWCPEFVEVDRWQQAAEDGRQFLASWGERADALGWTAQELFGLHPVPAKPHPSFQRLARYDSTGLVWLLHGRPVVGMTAESAVIRTASGGTVIYRKNNKPALGPLGDSLDDIGPCA